MRAQVVVEAKLDTAYILIGDQVRLNVTCKVGSRQRVDFPYYQPQEELTPGVEVVDNGRTDTTIIDGGRRVSLTRHYTITSFDSALYTLPPFKVKVDGKEYASSGNIGLKVNTVEVDTVHVDRFRGPHAVVDNPFIWSWKPSLLALTAWFSALVFVILLIRRSDPRLITRKIVIPPPTPAHVTALKGIEQIKQKGHSDPKAYYMELTDTLRDYIQQRFGFSAKEMTTQEIIDELYANEHEGALRELQEILLTADLVKFAKHTTSLGEQDRSLVQALDYVQATKYIPPVAPQPRIEYIAFNARNQRRLRLAMTLGTYATGIVSLSLSGAVIYYLYTCFF